MKFEVKKCADDIRTRKRHRGTSVTSPAVHEEPIYVEKLVSVLQETCLGINLQL